LGRPLFVLGFVVQAAACATIAGLSDVPVPVDGSLPDGAPGPSFQDSGATDENAAVTSDNDAAPDALDNESTDSSATEAAPEGDANAAPDSSFAPDAGGDSGVDAGGRDAGADSTAPGDGGPGVPSISGNIDFGLVNCDSAATPQLVTVGNTGGTAFTYSAVLGQGASSPYTISSGQSGSVDGGISATITIAPNAIPSTSAVPGNYHDTLTITTNVPGDNAHLVQLSEGAQGAILTFDTGAIPFGSIPVSSQQSSTFHLLNSGNLPATVTLAASGGEFSVTPNVATGIGPAMELTANATFEPTNTTSAMGTVNVTAPNATLCAPLPTGIALSGVGQNGGVSLSTNSLAFGPTNCGSTAPAQTITLTNSGNAPLSWSMALGLTPSPYSVSANPPSGNLGAGASTTITVIPSAIPATSSTAVNAFGDTLTVTTDVTNDSPHAISLNQTAQGAILSFQPTDVNFGSVPVNTTSTGDFSVVNSGNVSAHVTVTSNGTAFTYPNATFPSAVAGGASTSITAQFAPGTNTASQSATGTLSVAAGDVLCGSLPSPMTMEGTGTSGSVAFSPSSLNFGDVNCGTTASAQGITFTNAGNQSYTIQGALGSSPSPYTFSISPASGVVAANGGQATITVTPNAIPSTSAAPGSYGDVLTVTTSVTGDSPHPIQLSENAYGAILSVSPTTLAFPTTEDSQTSTIQMIVDNSGNAPATIVFTALAPAPPPNGSGPFNFQQNTVASAGGSATPNATFAPTAVQGYSGSAALGVANGTVLCAPLPGQSLSMSGSGSSAPPPVVVTPGTIDFGDVNCGTAAAANTSIQITNNTASPITASLSLGNTNGSNFTATIPNGGVIAANSSAKVTVTPKTIPISSNTQVGGDHFGDTLTITTNAAGDSGHTVTIDESAQGAILAFNQSTTHVPATPGSAKSFNVLNQGSLAASFTLTPSSSNKPPYTVSPLSGSINAAGSGGQTGVTIDVTKTGNFGTSETVSIAVPANQVICQPLPSAEQITTP
jgi:hypothetical protein